MREPAYALFLDPRLGKTRTVVDACAELSAMGVIDTLVAVAPAQVRSVWADADPILGEIAKWWPADRPFTVAEYRAKTNLRSLPRHPKGGLTVLVTNPEFVRRDERLEPLLEWMAGRKCLLAADESWQYQNATAAQTKALWKLGRAAVRRVILNGTPGEIKHQYAQYRILHPQAFGPYVKTWWQFRARFCRLGGWQNKEIVGYQNEAEFHAFAAPMTVYRKTAECRDVPPRVHTQIEVPLTPATWKIYTDMRKHLIAQLSSSEAAVAAHAATATVRLAQITNGFVGGVESSDPELWAEDTKALKVIGREKLDGLIDWLSHEALPAKVVIFARFRADVERAVADLASAFPSHLALPFYGDLPEKDRKYVKALFAVGGDATPAMTVVNAQSGGAGLDLAASPLCIFYGHEFSQRVRKQAEERIQGPHQGRTTYLDILATGPQGQPTIDHLILKAQRTQQDAAAWTVAQWREALLTEARSVA